MQCGLMCGIWDWQSTIVGDLNDSQDPKHTLFCRKNAFVAIYALFSDNKCPLFTRLGGGVAERGQCHLFYRLFYCGASLSCNTTSDSRLKYRHSSANVVVFKMQLSLHLGHSLSVSRRRSYSLARTSPPFHLAPRGGYSSNMR